MVRYLVVGNQTLHSEALLARLRQGRESGDCRFHVLVPASHPAGSWTWTEGGDHAAAEARLKEFLDELRGLGFEVTGEVGDANPVSAIGDVLAREPRSFDEIILSTLAPGLSRWLGQDVPRRVERSFGLPLTHVVGYLTRPHDGQEIPLPGTYEIDAAHSSIEFVARFLTISKIRGRFTQFAGTLEVAEVPEESSVEITIEATSIDTSDWRRDAHLRSADFLDVNAYPTLTFQSSSVAPGEGETWRATGDLTLRGITCPVVLDVEFSGVAVPESGELRVGFTAGAEIDREAWGLTWNRVVETGGVLVGRRVQIELDMQATRR
ncbi:MAG: YceI family protein [Actinomycetota bacterium]|nr:YceI family protein [Actinomycetota bacterium]